MDSTFTPFGEGIKSSATHIVNTHSLKFSKLDSNQVLQWMSRYNVYNALNCYEAVNIPKSAVIATLEVPVFEDWNWQESKIYLCSLYEEDVLY